MLGPIYSLLKNCRSIHKFQHCAISYHAALSNPVSLNRQSEMLRMNLLNQSQIVAETEAKKNYPRDYYYQILGLRRTATIQQIKSAYYSLAKRFHPDASNTPLERKRFQEISNAYQTLTDETKRAEYDQTGAVRDQLNLLRSVSQNGNDQSKIKGNVHSPATREDIARITKQEIRLDLTFSEAAHGVEKNLDVRVLKKCPMCNGKSLKQIHHPKAEKCRKCNGTGQLIKRTATFTSVTVCDHCDGKCFQNRNCCETCDSRGLVMETVKVAVKIPTGVTTGDYLPVEHPITKERTNYRIRVIEDDYFKRSGNDIHSTKYISISEAVLGASFKLRGLHDTLDVKTSPGMESHTQIVFNGKGIRTRAGTGNHIVTFKVRIPTSLTTKQRQLILALAKIEDGQN